MLIPPGNFAAYLFDCDGTIADSLPLHLQAWNDSLREWGGHFPRDLFIAWSGVPVRKTVEMLGERFGWNLPVDMIVERREKIYFELMPAVKAVPEVMEVILRDFGKIPFAVVSGSPRASVLKTLSFLKIEDRFETVVGADDCAKGKPNPDPYLLAAQRLGVEPARCLVFEDAELGVEAARAAGMQWVKIPIRI